MRNEKSKPSSFICADPHFHYLRRKSIASKEAINIKTSLESVKPVEFMQREVGSCHAVVFTTHSSLGSQRKITESENGI